MCVYVTSLYLCVFWLFKRKIKWLQPGSKSDVGGTALGAGLSDYRVLRSWHQSNLWAGNQLNARNEKCPDYGPDASPRKAVADYHELVAGEHVLTTATGVGALEVSSGVVLEVPLEGTCRRVEVEAEMTEVVCPPIGGGVCPGEAGEAIEEKAETDVRKTHEQPTRGRSQARHVGKIMMLIQCTLEGNSPR